MQVETLHHDERLRGAQSSVSKLLTLGLAAKVRTAKRVEVTSREALPTNVAQAEQAPLVGGSDGAGSGLARTGSRGLVGNSHKQSLFQDLLQDAFRTRQIETKPLERSHSETRKQAFCRCC